MIPLTLTTRAAFGEKDAPTALFCFEESGPVDAGHGFPAVARELWKHAQEDGYKAGAGECLSLAAPGGKGRFILVGLGKKKAATAETWRRAGAALVRFCRGRYAHAAASVPAAWAGPWAEGWGLASYRFEEYKKEDADKLVGASLLCASSDRRRLEAAAARASLYAEAANLVRTLVNRAPSDKTPQSLAELAKSLAGGDIAVEVLNRKAAAELGMGSFLGVARGSSVEPAFIHMTYKPKGAKRRIALVGKGITFDSGGLSLKPPQSMETMKCDMAGAATVLAVFKVLSRLKVKAEVHGICAATYNMPGPDAVKPGDVLRAMNGKTIEVLNTDAEGRLILADALVYAARQKPDAMIDLATLTGAVVIALGSKVTGAMTNNKALLQRLASAAKAAEEHLCELPLLKEYKENIKSSIADLQNIGKARGEAGSIIGGLFLEEFVEGLPWVHLDIAGTAWSDGETPCGPKGGTGAMVRTLLNYLASL